MARHQLEQIANARAKAAIPAADGQRNSLNVDRPAGDSVILVRARIGALRLAHGLMTALVFTIAGFDAFLERIGYPGLFAYFVLLGEVGRVRTSGVWTRGIALARLPNMLTADW